MIEGIELPKQEKIRMLGEKEIYKYLGILKADTINQVEMKEKIQKEYLRIMRKLPKSRLYSRILIKGTNTWVFSFVRYLGPFLKRAKEKHQQIDLRTRKLMMMDTALHPRDKVDRLYIRVG